MGVNSTGEKKTGLPHGGFELAQRGAKLSADTVPTTVIDCPENPAEPVPTRLKLPDCVRVEPADVDDAKMEED